MKPSAVLLSVAGALGILGSVLPWFEPHAGGRASKLTVFSWQVNFGYVPGALAVSSLSLGALLFAEATGRKPSSLPDIDELVRRTQFLPVLGLAASAYVWVKLPDWVTISTGCSGPDCTVFWIDSPGASRGTQPGFWLAVAGNVLAILVAMVSYRRRKQVTEATFAAWDDPLEA